MRGLPYKVTRNDILDFFQGLSVPLNGVHLMFNEREQPTGEAYVEFSSPDDRERAMTKDRQHIGGRYVELFRVGRGEMLAALEQFVGGYMNNQMMTPGAGARDGVCRRHVRRDAAISLRPAGCRICRRPGGMGGGYGGCSSSR